MSETAARLQSHNQEIVKCLDLLRRQQTALEKQIATKEKERNTLCSEMEKMQQMLDKLETSMAQDTQQLNECTKRLTETESGFTKVVDTLQLLVMSVKDNPKTETD
ncbi:uncharacterized protein LOC128730810 [Anopheles nili]|uniref:uncharacterized protein LOC128730810 n=1 Tax=Anopheles nili TaxID=185578 RepID=UPI00237ACA84|nr:uncharacterized protein LOC128730810 [Anopheles nili]